MAAIAPNYNIPAYTYLTSANSMLSDLETVREQEQGRVKRSGLRGASRDALSQHIDIEIAAASAILVDMERVGMPAHEIQDWLQGTITALRSQVTNGFEPVGRQALSAARNIILNGIDESASLHTNVISNIIPANAAARHTFPPATSLKKCLARQPGVTEAVAELAAEDFASRNRTRAGIAMGADLIAPDARRDVERALVRCADTPSSRGTNGGRIASVGLLVALGETIGRLVGRTPAYAALLAAHAVEVLAKAAESELERGGRNSDVLRAAQMPVRVFDAAVDSIVARYNGAGEEIAEARRRIQERGESPGGVNPQDWLGAF